MNNEVRKLKDDYKKCMEAIKEETYARNEAEELVKVLKDIVDAKSDSDKMESKIDSQEKDEVQSEKTVTEMEIDVVEEVDDEQSWRKANNKRRKHKNSVKVVQVCDKCEKKF